jgi:hypothetical protein
MVRREGGKVAKKLVVKWSKRSMAVVSWKWDWIIAPR